MELNARINWKKMGTDHYPPGINIFDEDWDNLIILDALRYDVFCEENTLPGEIEERASKGGGTQEFLRGNFKHEDLSEIVYVHANPQFDYIRDELDVDFHSVRNVWKDCWDDDLNTVPPEAVAAEAIKANSEFPEKRLLIHFVQPHPPYIGPTGQQHELGGITGTEIKNYLDELHKSFIQNLILSQDQELHKRAYRENLRLVLPHVQTLFEEIDGKFVVTSDHGEMFGERASPIPIKYMGHRIGCHVEELLSIPWLEYTSGTRREITSGKNKQYESAESDEVVDRLQQLGYIEN